LARLLSSIEARLEPLDSRPDELDRLGRAYLQGLRRAQAGTEGDARTQVYFAQMHLSLLLMGYGQSTGMLGLTYDWIIHSLSDHDAADQEVVFEPARWTAFFTSPHSTVAIGSLRMFWEWVEILFYYSRLEGGHRDLAADTVAGAVRCLRGAAQRFRESPAGSPEQALHGGVLCSAAPAACQIVSWAGVNGVDLDPDVVPLLASLFDTPGVPPEARVFIGTFMTSGFGAADAAGRRGWANRVLAKLSPHLRGHERLQLQIICLEDETAARARWPELIAETERYAREALALAGGDYPLFCYGQSRLFDILSPLLRMLTDAGRLDDLLELVTAWYAVPPSDRRRDQYLLCVPADGRGVHYAVEGRSQLFRQDQDESLRVLTAAGNRFFNTNVTRPDDAGLVPHVPDLPERRGVPVADAAPDYEAALRAHYHFAEAAPLAVSEPSPRSLLVIHGTRDPAQAMLREATGRILPFMSSFQPPLPDRSVLRVLLWSGGTLMSEIGLTASSDRLRRAGVQVERVPDEAQSAEEFVARYGDARYDVIWVDAHAEYDHYKPHSVFLRLFPGDDRGLPLSALVRVPVPRRGRRLLFLNVCDGGTATPTRGAAKLGLAPMLAGPAQAVISHLWPVEQILATLLDALLAIGLARTTGFLTAFDLAQQAVRAGSAAALELLRNECGSDSDIVRWLEPRSMDLDSLAAWGSPAIFE
jgi:hypothetical protein